MEILRLPMSFSFDRYPRADGIAVAFFSAQSECDRVANVLHRVAQNPELRPVPVFEDNFQTSIVIEVGERERAAVVGKVQSGKARHVGKRPIVVIQIEDVPLVAAPSGVRPDELIDSVPPQLVIH